MVRCPNHHLSKKLQHSTHAYACISLKQLVAAVITMVVTTAALHNHFYWFLCLDPEVAEYVPVENLFIFGIFTDGFPLFKGIAATLSCLVLANLPAMLQMPDFHFLNFFVKDGESSPSTWFLICTVEPEATELEESGITLDFTGYNSDE